MAKTHVVREGEHLSQIARSHGVSKDAIWQDSANESLRSHRQSSDLLNPGDQLVIPDHETVLRSAETGRRHVIELSEDDTISVKLRLQDDFGEGLADIAFEIHGTEGVLASGRTDAEGFVAATVPAIVTRAHLRLAELGAELELAIGALNPISCRSGVQQRLANLGFYDAVIDGSFGPKTRSALLRFQACSGLLPTGVADDATREALDRLSGRTPLALKADEDMECGQAASVEATDITEPPSCTDVPPPPLGQDEVSDLSDVPDDEEGEC